MKRYKLFYSALIILIFTFSKVTWAQNNPQHKILYFQMEPFDDSLFVQIQKEVFIQPPDPKAEIIVDLRDPNNQTVSIKGVLYPFLAFTPATRAKIITYPFKIDLEQNINYGSVFTNVISKINLRKFFEPPSAFQISSVNAYINPFLQMSGGERFGIPLNNDIGFSLGFGTPYSGPFETNFVEADFNILGFSLGGISSFDTFTDIKKYDNFNNLYVTSGFQLGYVIPLGNFFKIGYIQILKKPSKSQLIKYHENDVPGDTVKVLRGSYVDWELRYPIRILGSTRGKFYLARYVNEWHLGFTGRELSVAGSTFDLSLDALLKSDIREPQYVLNILIQKIGVDWAFSAFAVGPSVTFADQRNGKFGVISIFLNARIKVGTSL